VNKPLHTDPAPDQTTSTSRSAMSVAMTPGPVLGSLCTGYGGLDLAVLAALGGGRIAWCADPDPPIATILTARMPGVPNLGDLRTVTWTKVEPIDVLTAGFPCQDISAAGRRAGIEKGTRSGLWIDIVAVLRLLRPALFVVENVAALRWRHGGLHRVLGDLAHTGYDAIWRSVRAADIGAAHHRQRLFLLAWPHHHRGNAPHSPSQRWEPQGRQLTRGTPSRRAPSQPSRRPHLSHTATAHPEHL
jgi:DNA (cytosine-5)-methyltransferase 1